jgi:hypothetical protein
MGASREEKYIDPLHEPVFRFPCGFYFPGLKVIERCAANSAGELQTPRQGSKPTCQPPPPPFNLWAGFIYLRGFLDVEMHSFAGIQLEAPNNSFASANAAQNRSDPPMMALLYRTVPTFEDTWIECLGDLERYR